MSEIEKKQLIHALFCLFVPLTLKERMLRACSAIDFALATFLAFVADERSIEFTCVLNNSFVMFLCKF